MRKLDSIAAISSLGLFDGRIERARGTEAEYERDTQLVDYEDGSIVIEPAPFEMGWIKGVDCK